MSRERAKQFLLPDGKLAYVSRTGDISIRTRRRGVVRGSVKHKRTGTTPSVPTIAKQDTTMRVAVIVSTYLFKYPDVFYSPAILRYSTNVSIDESGKEKVTGRNKKIKTRSADI
ncbi:hypothetical protein V1478_014025 [Vespula squamosa]|uniref:Uncharacterized protein n=1 Tax=Vespula squamosa TaxID=30214 RepID=A0ABD2A6V5_VESSQ